MARSRGGFRSFLSALLIIVAVVLAPVAAVGSWVRVQLTDTDAFVKSFAPLAEVPEVQRFVADEAARAIGDRIDVAGIASSVLGGISSGIDTGLEKLGVPEKWRERVPGVPEAAADRLDEQVRDVIRDGVAHTVESPRFARVWETTLELTHARLVAMLRADDDAALGLDDAGTVTLELGNVVAEAKQALEARDSRLASAVAERIPDIDISVPVYSSDALAKVGPIYRFAITALQWLPWVLAGLGLLGVVCARRSSRALAFAGFGLALMFGALLWALRQGPIPLLAPPTAFPAVIVLISTSVVLALIGCTTWAMSSSRRRAG